MKTLLAPSSLLLIAPLALVACGGGEPETTPDTPSTSGNDTAATTTPEPEAPKTPAPLADATADNPVVVAEDGSAAKVYLTGSDQMKYNLTEVAVPAGAIPGQKIQFKVMVPQPASEGLRHCEACGSRGFDQLF